MNSSARVTYASYMTSIKILLFLFTAIFASLGFDISSSVYAATPLTNGVSIAVSLSADEEKLYSIEIPADASGLEVTLSGGSGDLDLYTNSPDTASFDCSSSLFGNNEICTHIDPVAGTWYIMVQGFSAGNSTLTATYTTGGEENELSSGEPVSVSLSAGEEKLYFIQVPADASGLKVTLSGGSGDLDIYTRPGIAPDTGSYTCRPYINGNNETCIHDAPAQGIWYIMVRGYSAGSSTLTATYTSGSGAITQLSNGDAQQVSLSVQEEKLYFIEVPANATKLEVKLSGGDGDLDIYTRPGTVPNTGNYTCRPYINGNNETCTHDAPVQGIWYIMVRGFSTGSSTLTATYTSGSGSIIQLSNGDAEQVSLSAQEEKLYSIEVPANVTKLEVKLSGGDGDLDIYTRYNVHPKLSSFDCRPYIGGNNETCTHNAPAAGTWYIMVRGYSAGNSTLTATYSTGGGSGTVTQLSNGESVLVSLSTGEESFYSIEVPAGTTSLEVTLSGGDGDLDIYTRYNAYPELSSFDCRPYIGGNNETCTHNAPAEGIWYIMVRGYSAGASSLTASYGSSANNGMDSGQLPVAKMVWSSWYWPMKDSLNPNLYDNNEALYRYDLYAGGASDAQRWEYNQHGPPLNPDGWWGHCHAWAAAACWESQPVQSKTLDDVTFRVRDRKGLMIEAYYTSANGFSYELIQDDPSPGLFWLYLQNEIAGKNPIHGEAVGFIGELYYGDQVWNHPIYAYETEHSGSGTVSGKITIWYATDFQPYMADSTSLYADTLTYYFKDVVLSGSTPTDSGTWILEDGSLPSAAAGNYSSHRPDAVWRPYKASFWTMYAENPHLDDQRLSDILGQK